MWYCSWSSSESSSVHIVIVMSLVWSWQSVEVIPEFLYDAPEQLMDMFERMTPIDYAFYPTTVHDALIETLHIATLGTLITLLFAVPLALLNAPNITPSKTINWIAQFFLVATRSINSLVWALLFIKSSLLKHVSENRRGSRRRGTTCHRSEVGENGQRRTRGSRRRRRCCAIIKVVSGDSLITKQKHGVGGFV